jgi:Rrf2 family protein
MIALAQNAGESLTILQIATGQEIPKKFLEQILLALKAAGLLSSRAGPRGGYGLLHAPETITVRRVLEAVEEPISQSRSDSGSRGNGGSPRKLQEVLEDIRRHIRRQLDNLTIADLAASDLAADEVQTLMYYI